ncbi:MAG: hypothetical protein R2788_06240 [Saprospiraceae bacterium]
MRRTGRNTALAPNSGREGWGGNVIGQKIVYGFAKYLRDALPHATYLGFTGSLSKVPM